MEVNCSLAPLSNNNGLRRRGKKMMEENMKNRNMILYHGT